MLAARGATRRLCGCGRRVIGAAMTGLMVKLRGFAAVVVIALSWDELAARARR